jgi:hypothetical protein
LFRASIINISATMPKPNDLGTLAWQHVEELEVRGKTANVKRVQCSYCPHEYTGGTTRIISHLLGLGNGVKPCPQCPADVASQLAAAKASSDAAENAKSKKRHAAEARLACKAGAVELRCLEGASARRELAHCSFVCDAINLRTAAA